MKCEFCQEEVSDKAIVCKHCHNVLNEKEYYSKRKSNKTSGCCSIIITVVIIYALYVYIRYGTVGFLIIINSFLDGLIPG